MTNIVIIQCITTYVNECGRLEILKKIMQSNVVSNRKPRSATCLHNLSLDSFYVLSLSGGRC